MNRFQKIDGGRAPWARSRKSHLFAANVSPPQKGSPQEALFAGDKDQLRGVNKVELLRVNNDANVAIFD